MKVLIVSGSPRKGKNSEMIARYCKSVLTKEGIETEMFNLSEHVVGPCIHCDHCQHGPGCSIKDSMPYGSLSSADAIIFITPTYMGGMTSQLKAFIDRSVSLRRNGFQLKGKPGAAIAVGGSRNGGQEHAISQVHQALLIHGMVVVGDSSHFGGIVHAPFAEDKIGKKTVEDTVKTLISFYQEA